jgi:hypothetical protein
MSVCDRRADADRLHGDVQAAALGGPQPFDGLREAVLGDLQGTGAQPLQRARHRAGDHQQGEQGNPQDRKDQQAVHQRATSRRRGEVLALPDDAVEKLGLDPPHQLELGGGRREPLRRVDAQPGAGLVVEGVLLDPQRVQDRLPPHTVGEQGPLLLVGVGLELVERGLLLRDQVREFLELAEGEASPVRDGEEGPANLGGDRLGPREVVERPDALRQILVPAGLGDLEVHVQQRVDDARVPGEDGPLRQRPRRDRGPQLAELVEPGPHGVQPGFDARP